MKLSLILLAVLLGSLQAQNAGPIIHYVSGDPTSQVSPAYSSLRGGKLIYLMVTGHDPMATGNQVYVGTFPCKIPSDGVTDTFITCETTDSYSNSDITSLPVTLISNNVAFTTAYPNVVTYSNSYTPYLTDVFPASGYANSVVNFYGVHRITDLGDGRVMGDVNKILLGGDLCSRFDVVQAAISSTSYQYIECIESSLQVAGKYNVTEWVTPGYANHDPNLRRASLTPNDYFQFTALPTVASISPSNGNLGGQYITITGTGFSAQSANNTVTVDGNPCSVTAASGTQISCTLAPRDPGVSSLLTANNASTQQNGYFGGAGLKYARYSLPSTATISTFMTATRNNNASYLGTPQQVGFRAELKEGDVYGSNYGQSWKGYFTAPVTGTYVFRGIADDYFAVYLSSDFGSTTPAASPLIYSSTPQTNWNNFYYDDVPTAEATISLTAGQSYYLQAYHINSNGGGFFKVETDVPNTDTSLPFQTYQVDKIITSSTIDPEIVNYTMTAGNPGTINLKLVRTSGGKITYNVNTTITYGCTAAVFLTALNKFDSFSSYQASVVRTIYDSGNNVINTTAGASIIVYTVSLYLLRSAALSSEDFIYTYTNYTGAVSKSIVQAHSPLISGTFVLSIGNVQFTNISYNAGASTIRSLLNSIVGYEKVQVDQVSANGAGYSNTWIIKYIGVNGAVPNATVSGAGLTGGSTTPTISISVRRQYSSSVTFSPIDYRFLNTFNSKPSVLVSTNGIPAICTSDCGYTFKDVLKITSLTQTTTTLSLAISVNPSNLTVDVSSFTVTVQDRPCAINPSSTLSALTCTLTTNQDGSPLLVAGDVTPIVYSNPIGIAGLDVGVTPISVPLVVSQLTVASGGNNGGYYNYIVGSGFPLDKSQVTVSVCGSSATVITSNNQRIGFYMPACQNVDSEIVTVQVGNLTDTSQSFTYTDGTLSAPTISSISPTSRNPAIKGVLQIVGSGFGTNKTAVQVFLSNSSGKVYQLNVLSVNDTNVAVGLSGGLPGTFTVQVTLPEYSGNNVASAGADQFQYISSITSVSPSTGSYYGGTLLTITGTNFSPAYSDTLVYVGDKLNWFCNIQTITDTQITCRTPPISTAYTVGSSQRVVISTKLYSFNTCPGNNCNFSYLPASSGPTLSTISASTANAVTLTLTGSNFISVSTCSVSLTSASNSSIIYTTPGVNCTNNSTKFTVPKTVPSGNYLVKVRNEIGESNGKALAINWAMGTPNYNSGGSVAGSIVTFSGGSGYPASLGTGYNLLVQGSSSKANYPVNIVSCCDNNVLVLSMPAVPSNTALNIIFKGPLGSNQISYIAQQSLTPVINLPAGSDLSPGVSSTVTFTRTDSLSMATVNVTSLKLVSTIDSTNVITVPTWTVNATSRTYTFTVTLNSGAYSIQALTPNGYCQVNNVLNVSLDGSASAASVTSGFAGGVFTVTGSNLSPSSYITVNGFTGGIVSYSPTTVTYNIPAFTTTSTQSAFSLQKADLLDSSKFTFTSDVPTNSSNVTAVFDGSTNTIYGSSNSVCWIGIDVGQGLQAQISRIRYFPFLDWENTVNYTLGAVFEASNDQSSWTTLGTFDQTVHSGWNFLQSASSSPFRYIRFRHTSQSQCNIAEIQLYGILLSNQSPTLSGQPSSVIYNDGYNTKTFSNAIQFTSAATPTVTSVVPPYGDIFGGYSITISGTNLGFGTPNVVIDGIPCVQTAYNTTQITCTVGARPNLPTSTSFSVTIGNSKAIIVNDFLYVLKWSDSRTWGVDLPPIQGDLVYVPPGMTLLVDQTTPILAGISVQDGTLIFPNDTDITVNSYFINMNGGRFIAGTESAPLHSQLTFVMYGNYYGKQLPMFGNKGIGCLNCKFSMYGRPRKPTWTTIAATISPGDTTFTLSTDVDWQVGEHIVVASTSFFHYQAEERTIVSIANRTVTVNSPFQYQHVSVEETYGSADKLVMRAEVGLLSRNIKMMGDPTSAIGKYGSHLMLSGTKPNALEGHVAYTEFTQCGQPQILGRYCIHFHMAKEVPTSFVRGNAVHDSFARVVTIHGVYLLLVEQNVGYRVHGHNFFVQDGIETHNTIRNNLAISSLTVTNMLQTDISVASFWVTNPTNDFYGNHAAGGDFYGIWYEIKANPDGPSATNDICPPGNPLGYVANNVAHSNIRFGLRIFQLYSRKFPCQDVRDDTNATDPWFSNPSIPSIFYNFTIYKNLEDGVLSEQSGNLMITNFTIAENYHAGVEFYVANFTKEMVSVNNCAIIGQSQTNMASDPTNYTSGMAGVITPRSGQTNITNTRFYNYPAGSIAFITCSKCDDKMIFTNLGTEVFVKNLTFDQVDGNYLEMLGVKRDIIYDLDGSLSGPFDGGSGRTSAAIMHNFPHIAQYNHASCVPASSPAMWDSAIMCDQTVTIRRIYITNAIDPYVFNAQFMKVIPISSYDEIVDPNITSTLYTAIDSRFQAMQPKKEQKHSWSLPYITGQIYQIWWGTGMDFSHIAVSNTRMYTPNDDGVIFKFNYTLNRELYFVGPMRGGKLLQSINYISEEANFSQLTPTTCKNGQYFHDNDNSSLRMLLLCQSGKNKTMQEYTEVNAVICLYHCPAPAGTFIKENFTRRWSNASQWPNGTVPGYMDNVTVNGNWTVLLDIDPAPANYLIIDGTLVADDTRDVNITARSIFIRAGNVSIGSPSSPFQHKFTMQVSNNKEDHGWYIDPLVAGNKYIVVTGSLNLYGVAPNTVTTSLTASASAGDQVINVDSSDGWAVGDTLALSPSYGNYLEYETVTITSINNATSIGVTTLQYNHYGSSSEISTPYGSIDVNTHVGHINRNVKIVPGPDYGWGVNLLVYGFLDGDIQRVGSVQLSGVQIQDGGQYDTTSSALQFLNVLGGNYSSSITDTSFVNCKAWCVNVDNAQNITFTNNVFYNAWVFGVQAKVITNFIFTNNLFIGVTERPTLAFGSQLVACFGTYDYINPATSGVTIKNNFCLGSQGHGFAFPHIKCNQLEVNPFANNTAGSCQIGFIFNNIPDSCKAFSYAKAYANEIGQICGPPSTTKLVFKNFVMVDNQRGVTLKFGNGEGHSNHTGVFSNSYISAVSRPNCAQCYGDNAISCKNSVGLRLLSASANGEILPGKFGPGFDVICKQELYQNKVYMSNVIFDRFNQTYLGTVASVCGNNYVFRPHGGAFDTTADTNLFNVSCNNCDTKSYLLADPNSPSQIGWFGGCGDILCTGRSNFVIVDWTGTFLGFQGTIIPNNTVVGNNQPGCTFVPHMNSHICTRTDFAVLAYQSIAADFNTRIMWPMNLTYEGSNYTTVTNGWREWDWSGKEPLNHRFGRFVSIVKLNSVYNLTGTAMPPLNMQFQIQKRTPEGNNSNYVVIKMYYPLPNMIQIKVNGDVVEPILLIDGGRLNRSLDTSICGDNAYFYTNYTTHFVVTEDVNCLVEVLLTDTIQLTTHFAMNASDFFTNNRLSSFISNLCALLGVTDTSRVKVVGIVSGSTIVTTAILPTGSGSNATNATNATNSSGGASLAQIQATLTSQGQLVSSGLASALNTTVISVSSTLYTISTTQDSTSASNIGIIVGVTVAGVILIVVMVWVFFYCLRKRAKIVEEIRQSEEQVHHEKQEYVMGESGHFEQGSHTSQFKIVQDASKQKHHGLDE